VPAPMLPAAIYLLVMFVYPFAYGVVLSLQAKDGGLSLANYLAFLLDPWQARTIWVTASIAVPNTVLTVLLALVVAYRMRRGMWMERTITTALVLPIALGTGPWATFRGVMWPLIAPGVAIAFALVFVMNFGVFPSAVLVGQPAGATRTIAIAAYQQAFEHSDMAMASAIAVVMGACQLVGLGVILVIRRRMAATGVATMGAGKR